ncbi:MAG: flagellar biosynthetic protein FliQ [Sandaracinus sp.]|nr:flagellar biosynthetic protein FliQ [Sandaracinus sp.]MCB9632464.1 flagellar biosynthetic protein FliQ [Sandaracinus sp.]
MNAGQGLDWFRELLWTALVAASPVVLTVVIVGLMIAVVQAATQVNDQAVAFGPKALAVLVALVASGPFLLGELVDFTRAVLAAIGDVTP